METELDYDMPERDRRKFYALQHDYLFWRSKGFRAVSAVYIARYGLLTFYAVDYFGRD